MDQQEMNDYEALRLKQGKTEDEFYQAYGFLILISEGYGIAPAYREIFYVTTEQARVNAGSFYRRAWVKEIQALIAIDAEIDVKADMAKITKLVKDTISSNFEDTDTKLKAAALLIKKDEVEGKREVPTVRVDVFAQIAQVARDGKMISQDSGVIDVGVIDD